MEIVRYDYSTTLSEEFAMFTKYYQVAFFEIQITTIHHDYDNRTNL